MLIIKFVQHEKLYEVTMVRGATRRVYFPKYDDAAYGLRTRQPTFQNNLIKRNTSRWF